MTNRIIDGRTISRQQLLHVLRDACTSASGLCDASISPSLWQDRAKSAIKICSFSQRCLVSSHPHLSDELHILATEIQIALAAQDHPSLFAERVRRIRAAVQHVQESNIDVDRPEVSAAPAPGADGPADNSVADG
jgi:hypothetical protein